VVTTTRKLDQSSDSKDHQWLLEIERSVGQLSDPDEPEIPHVAEASDFPIILTEEQEDALQEYEDAAGTIDSAYSDFQSATDDFKEAYRTVVQAFGFIPAE
jgi:hypothetical protein